MPLVWAAQAVSRRAIEAAKRTEANEREPRTRQMLADLKEWERCEYAPAGPQPGRGFPVDPTVSVVIYNLALTDRLRLEADEAARAAVALELQEFNLKAGGQVSASSIEGLIEEVIGDGRHVVPPLREVERWALEAEQVSRDRLRRTRAARLEGMPDPETAPPTWTLTWRGREVVAGESRVSLLGLAGSAGADNYFDSAEGFEQVGERSWMRPAEDGALLDSAAELAEVGGLADEEEEVAAGG